MSGAYNNPDHEPEKIDLSSDHIQSSVDTIKNHTEYGQTPFWAVQAAYDKMLNTPDANANTQYWLVILTDGDFNDGIIQNPKDPDELTEKFEDHISTPMPNGSNLQISYFAIGDSATKVPSQENKGIHIYSCAKDSEIINNMSDIADKISGRTRLDPDEITMPDDRTILFSSSVSLLNIAALVEKSGAKIVSATYSNKVSIPVSRKAELSFTEFYDNKTGVSFIITKDGKQLDKSQIGDSAAAVLNERYKDMDLSIEVDDVTERSIVFLLQESKENTALRHGGATGYTISACPETVLR